MTKHKFLEIWTHEFRAFIPATTGSGHCAMHSLKLDASSSPCEHWHAVYGFLMESRNMETARLWLQNKTFATKLQSGSDWPLFTEIKNQYERFSLKK